MIKVTLKKLLELMGPSDREQSPVIVHDEAAFIQFDQLKFELGSDTVTFLFRGHEVASTLLTGGDIDSETVITLAGFRAVMTLEISP